MTKMTLPVSFNEPTSLLQRVTEDMVRAFPCSFTLYLYHFRLPPFLRTYCGSDNHLVHGYADL